MNGFQPVAKLAERQGGLVSRQQILRLGISRDAVKRALQSGALLKARRGVFRVPGGSLTDMTRLWAAVLWCGFDAYLSHRTAAWCWGLDGVGTRLPARLELITRTDSRWVAPPDIHVRRALKLNPRLETTIRKGLPCTTLARTLIDLAAVLEPQALEQAFDSAVRRADDFDRDVFKLLRRLGSARRKGHGLITAVADRNPTLKTGSPLEIITRDVLLMAGIRQPLPQFSVRDANNEQIAVVDFAWTERNVALFVHSDRWHRSRGAVEKDRAQTNALVAAGWRVLAVTDQRLRKDRAGFLDELRATLTLDATSISGD
jgi:hypothetical protein